jgi:hypothetical protein
VPSGTAPGFRGAESGLVRYVGRGGSIWSSSISDANAYYLNFLGDGAIVPNYLRFRAIGLPLRCLQEQEPIGPAPGFRALLDGTLCDVGNGGYDWASTVQNTSGYRLYFNNDTPNPNDYGRRGYGFQLRCLQEHPQGVLLGFSQPNLNRACQARKFVLGRGAARHSNRAASTPYRGRRLYESRRAQF